MEKLSFKNFTISTKKVYSKEQELADQIWNYLDKKIPFPRLMKIIKQKGYKATYELWNEIKQSKANNHLALFLWKIGQEKIRWLDQAVE